MRLALTTMAVLLAAPVPVAAQEQDPDRAVEGGELPAGWSARTDRDRPLDNVRLEERDGDYHITLGPATVFYRSEDSASGSYRVSATFTQKKAPTHPEAYGLLIGGNNLDGAEQSYTYLIIRGTGQFMVKRRTGATTETVVPWTNNSAIETQGEDGQCTNRLAIEIQGDQVSFQVNGEVLYRGAASELDTEGVYGLRINHNLDLKVSGFQKDNI